MVSNCRSTLLVFMLLALLLKSAHGQSDDDPYQFGDISLSDLKMQVYEKDSSAAALVLLDYGVLGYDDVRKRVSYTCHIRIKILKAAAFELADVSLPYIGKAGIREIKAATHNLVDGAIQTTFLAEESIIEEKVQDRLRVKKLLFPNVLEGSILEYTYEMQSLSPWQYLPWYFQGAYPVRKSEFMLAFPGSEDVYPRVYGQYDVNSYEKTNGKLHHLIMEDVPAFVKEPYVNALDDYYSKVSFEYVNRSAASWELLIERIMDYKEFGLSLSRLNQLKSYYPKSKNWKADKKSLQEIHSYVKGHFEWNGALSMAFTDKPKKVWESGSGTSADINLMLLMFLKKAGFVAYPVFLSSKNYGVVDDHYPTFNQFNNVVVDVAMEGDRYLMDATSKHLSYNLIPEYCLNGKGLVIKKGPQEWVSMSLNNQKSIRSVSVKFEIDDLGDAIGRGDVNWSGSAAVGVRASSTDKEAKEVARTFNERLAKIEMEDLSFEGLDDPYENLRASFGFSSETIVDDIGGKLFFSPVVWPEIDENPFKAKERRLPVDFPIEMNRKYFFNVTIPEGYEVEELPEPVNFVLPNGGGRYVYYCQQQGNSIQTMVRFQLERISFTAAEYPSIRELFKLIIAKQEEKVVLAEK